MDECHSPCLIHPNEAGIHQSEHLEQKILDGNAASATPKNEVTQPVVQEVVLESLPQGKDHSQTTSPYSSGSCSQLPVHRCHICNRNYERADHLNRHLKSHENARPYRCTKCPKRFNRADLLNRHNNSHERYANSDKSLRVSRYDRVTTACNACVASKSKCQEQKPCIRCISRKIPCEFQQSKNRSAPATRTGNSARDNLTLPYHSSTTVANKNGQLGLENHINTAQKEFELENNLVNEHLDYSTPEGPPASSTDTYMCDQSSTSVGSLNDKSIQNYDNVYNSPFPFPGQNYGLNLDESDLPWALDFGQPMDFGLYEIDLEGIELECNTLSNAQSKDREIAESWIDAPSTKKWKSKRYAAFERSPWLWTPTSSDQTLNDQEHISLNEGTIPAAFEPSSPETRFYEFSHCYINTQMRDKMLSLVISVPKVNTRNLSFPSLDLLNTIIQVYFAQESNKVDTFIHSATLEPNETLPHLIMAIVSGGSLLISTPAIWKMGLALQEITRHTVADFWEQNNSNTRNLQALQAFMIYLDIGLWCGFKRKMEIAESFSQPMMTMLRRAGAFEDQHNLHFIIPRQEDSETLLDLKWKKWIEIESLKRLILHLFFHDVHSSASLQKPPLTTLTELKFGLPASRQLWMTKTSREWRDIYTAQVPRVCKKMTFRDLLEDPEILHTMTDYIDVHLCTMALLYGYWSQIWSIAESKSFYPASKTTHHLSLITSQKELYCDLVDLASKIPLLTNNSPVTTLFSEFFMMILHVSLADLQRFAGKFGEEEARCAYLSLQSWSQTTESRVAVWHAGQVLRATRDLTTAQLRDANAVAVYYSSLALWVYGLVSSNPSNSSSTVNGNQQGVLPLLANRSSFPDVVLTGPKTAQVTVFIASGKGNPGILSVHSSTTMFIPLKETDKILSNSREIYQSNFPPSSDPLPSLVVNLVNLLKELESCRSNVMSRACSEELE